MQNIIYNLLCDMHSFALYRFYNNITYRVVYRLVLYFMLNLNIAEKEHLLAYVCYSHS